MRTQSYLGCMQLGSNQDPLEPLLLKNISLLPWDMIRSIWWRRVSRTVRGPWSPAECPLSHPPPPPGRLSWWPPPGIHNRFGILVLCVPKSPRASGDLILYEKYFWPAWVWTPVMLELHPYKVTVCPTFALHPMLLYPNHIELLYTVHKVLINIKPQPWKFRAMKPNSVLDPHWEKQLDPDSQKMRIHIPDWNKLILQYNLSHQWLLRPFDGHDGKMLSFD